VIEAVGMKVCILLVGAKRAAASGGLGVDCKDWLAGSSGPEMS
jgi:hypothetical protein